MDEGSTAHNTKTADDLPNTEQQKRKRKLSFDTSANQVQQSATLDNAMEQTRAKKQKEPRWDEKQMDKKKLRQQTQKRTPHRKKCNRKENDVAKEAAMQFVKCKSDASLLSILSMQPETI